MAQQTHTTGPAEHHGPTVQQYVRIFVILFIATATEVAVAEFLEPVVPSWVAIGLLIGLMAFKGLLVVMFYMHLRFDSYWFRFLFTAGMILATLMTIAFSLLFAYKIALGTDLPPLQ